MAAGRRVSTEPAPTLQDIAAEQWPGIPEAAELIERSARAETLEERQAAAARLVQLGREQILAARARNGGPAALRDPDVYEQSEAKARDLGARSGRIFAPVTVGHLYETTNDTVVWLLHQLIPLGGLVLLAAFMKAGKTTFTYALVAAIVRGVPFLGRETRRCNVLILALEESKRDVKRRLRRFGVPADAAVSVQFRPVPTNGLEWAALLAFVRDHDIKLLVVDTLARCWPAWGVDSENDNAQVSSALAPLLDLCRDGDLTVLLLHHTAKMAEGHGREIRGAGAILAMVDQALLFDRYRAGEPEDRILRTLGRYEESPAELVLRFDKSAVTFSVVSQDGASEEARGAERIFPAILAYLRRRKGNGATVRDVRGNVPGRGVTKDRALELLAERGLAVLRDSRYYHGDHAPGVEA